ncbi:DEAD/DEAH box helicase [Crocinitomix algicola]|uniref:DEAD/DEAH box helicase n=1 Tax=Crocinitomix algicola TaxID=1740263 RepID=UPI000872D698|nr:DEAD/DEAH box helicase [Crocinitomix algicola]
MKFTELELKEGLLEALSYMGFETATPIQEKAIPIILKNYDLIACAQTGTGKTAAFVLPILNKLIGKKDTSIDTLIIVPTRELAIQIEQQIQGLSYFLSVGSKAVYGGGSGKDWEEQKNALKEGTDIIVATPGKLLSHLKMGYVNFKNVKHLILDEADRMLDMGFLEDITEISSHLPKNRQTLMFSATMPTKIKQLARKILNDPKEVSLAVSKPAEGVTQAVYLTFDNQKIPILTHILNQRKEYDSIIIFTSAKAKVSEINRSLRSAGFKSKPISSNLDQDEREEVLRLFRAKKVRILVATDVMSRGIDIKEINMVVNFDVPHDAEDYVHRIGRTARANTKGEAFTLVNPKDFHKLSKIERLIDAKVTRLELPEEFGVGPEWKSPSKKKKNKPYYKKRKNFTKKKSNK